MESKLEKRGFSFFVKESKNIPSESKKRGFSILELGIVFVIIGVVVIAAFTGYNKLYLPSVADGEYKKISSVISGADRSKNLNGGVYPVGSTSAITVALLPNLANSLGGAGGVKDLAGWTYDCTAGSGKTVTIVPPTYDDPVVAGIVASLINSNNDAWSAAVSGATSTTVTVTKANATCQ